MEEISFQHSSKVPSAKDWRYYVISPTVVALLWIGVLALGSVAARTQDLGTSALCFAGIALLQNGLMLLHHEGSHFLIFPNRRVNDWITDLFCGLPFGERLGAYRDFHFKHHRWVADSTADPEVPYYQAQGYFYKPRNLRALAGSLILDLMGFNWAKFNVSFIWGRFRIVQLERLNPSRPSADWESHLRVVLFIFIVGAFALTIQDFWKVLLTHWILPQATLTFLLGKIRSYGEHGHRSGTVQGSTFHHQQNWFYRICIAPLNSHLHLEHHLKPSTPFFLLPHVRTDLTLEPSPKIQGLFFGNSSLLKKVLWDGAL